MFARDINLNVKQMLLVIMAVCMPAATGWCDKPVSQIETMAAGKSFTIAGNKVVIEQMDITAVAVSDYSSVFSFDKFENPKLGELRERYDLDAVVSGGIDEFDRQVLLMDWVRRRIKKFGTPSARAKGALEILEAADGGETFYCMHYAHTLVSAAASMGWIDRPLALRRPDHLGERSTEHAVTEIWSNQYNKWVMFDPTYGLYVEKEGIPLNGYELRQEWFLNEGRDLVFVMGKDRKRYTAGDLPVFLQHHPGFGDLNLTKNTLHKFAFIGYIPNTDLMDSELNYSDMFIVKDEIGGDTKWHRRRNPQDPAEEPYFNLNQADIKISAGDDGVLKVDVRTMTPNFKTFQMRVDSGKWVDCEEQFSWAIHVGENSLEVRSVNKFDVSGVVSRVVLRVDD